MSCCTGICKYLLNIGLEARLAAEAGRCCSWSLSCPSSAMHTAQRRDAEAALLSATAERVVRTSSLAVRPRVGCWELLRREMKPFTHRELHFSEKIRIT
jgi:hypothetical protein